MIKVVSMDGAVFTANREDLVKFQTFANMCEDETEEEIIIPMLRTEVLKRVLEFCKHYAEEPMTEIPQPITSLSLCDLVQPFYVKFAFAARRDCPNLDLFCDIVEAANYLRIDPLLKLLLAFYATQNTNKVPEEIIQWCGYPRETYTDEDIRQIEEGTRWTDREMALTAGKDEKLLEVENATLG